MPRSLFSLTSSVDGLPKDVDDPSTFLWLHLVPLKVGTSLPVTPALVPKSGNVEVALKLAVDAVP